MQVKTYSLKPYFNIEGHFINIPGMPTFDPKHPSIYPGDEVVIKEVLSPADFIAKYGKKAIFNSDVIYSQSGQQVFVLERTGRTSGDILEAIR